MSELDQRSKKLSPEDPSEIRKSHVVKEMVEKMKDEFKTLMRNNTFSTGNFGPLCSADTRRD